MAIPGQRRVDSTILVCHLSRRRKTSNRNQVEARSFTRPTRGKESPKKNRVQNDAMVVPLSFEHCGVVLLVVAGKEQHRASSLKRSSTSATDYDSDPSGLTIDGKSRVNRLVGLVVRRPPRERKIPGSNPACAGIFFGVESYQ